MAKKVIFPARPDANPTIYAYSDNNPQYDGMLKIGYTIKSAQERVAEQYPILKPGKIPYVIHIDEPAIRRDGSVFTDKDVHRILRQRGFVQLHDKNGKLTEWFKCAVSDVMAAITSLRTNENLEIQRTETFAMRPEQAAAVEKQWNIFKIGIAKILGKRHTFYGMPKCALAKHLPHINWR